MQNPDVIVIGAGPAGLLAAREAAEKGVGVLVLERERALGKKVCAEAISDKGLRACELNSKEFVVNEIFGARVYAPDESKNVEVSGELMGEEGGHILDRRKYLESLAEAATKGGAEIRFGACVVDVQRDGGFIKTIAKDNGGTQTLLSRIALGCDGFSSVVARKFFDTSKMEFISCIQYKLEGCRIDNEHELHFYLGNEVAPRGYLWVFPKGKGLANVGVGVRGKPAKLYLDKFLQKHPEIFADSKILNVGGAPVVVSGQLDKVVSDNVMICGEAAGHVIPLTGAGIHTSAVAGRIAGRVAAEAVLEQNFTQRRLSEYIIEFNKIWADRIMKSLKALRVIERLSDSELNIMAEVLKGEDILDIANGVNLERAAKALLKHPVLAIKVARALMT